MLNRVAESKKNNDFSIINNPWDKKVTSTITIKITDQKYGLKSVSHTGFGYTTNVVIENKKEVTLESLHFDKLLEVDPNNNHEIIIEDSHLSEKRVFKLPGSMNKNLFHFLTGGRRKGDNCRDFVNAMFFGCGKLKINEIRLNGEATVMFKDDKDLEIGQAIGIGKGSDKDFRIIHFAIYIGGGLFISPPGPLPLIITTLEQMQLLYKAENAAKITPTLPSFEKTFSSSYTL